MHTYTAHVHWSRGDQDFLDNRYSRRHLIEFDGGVVLPGSSSPHVVRVPLSDPAAVDPEESFVASLSSCHMLWFLSLAAARGFRVDRYADRAEGVMAKNARGKLYVSTVTLRPQVSFSGERLPSPEEFQALHHEAHEECFIANSVLTEVRCEPVLRGDR
ncbi:OsmC family protein [uncultured Azohydromonas sp.]|jgi:Predicted redox protein, regulator of disulfide bond formation|uniref:OsmC family protein n=1 Tax=uncultured Azohydromonas sp. TaxID=487342 RepID=UPI00263739EB|nr:OsmC family protein [uncultured Azohydromonas sp.]